jgi:hypothetical protein
MEVKKQLALSVVIIFLTMIMVSIPLNVPNAVPITGFAGSDITTEGEAPVIEIETSAPTELSSAVPPAETEGESDLNSIPSEETNSVDTTEEISVAPPAKAVGETTELDITDESAIPSEESHELEPTQQETENTELITETEEDLSDQSSAESPVESEYINDTDEQEITETESDSEETEETVNDTVEDVENIEEQTNIEPELHIEEINDSDEQESEINETTVLIEEEVETNDTVTNDTLDINGTALSEQTTQSQVIVNQPVKWKKIIELDSPTSNVEIKLPAEAENIVIKDSEGKIIKNAKISGEDVSQSDKSAPEVRENNLLTGAFIGDSPFNLDLLFDWLVNILSRFRGITGFTVSELQEQEVVTETTEEQLEAITVTEQEVVDIEEVEQQDIIEESEIDYADNVDVNDTIEEFEEPTSDVEESIEQEIEIEFNNTEDEINDTTDIESEEVNDIVDDVENTEEETQEEQSEDEQQFEPIEEVLENKTEETSVVPPAKAVGETEVLIEEEISTAEIEYETAGPTAIETEFENGIKTQFISSEIHYVNALTSTEVPDVPAEAIRLYWHEETEVYNNETNKTEIVIEKKEVTTSEEIALNFIDENNNTLIDKISWIIPHLSNQTFEISITILNPHTFVRDNETWTVAFETIGVGDLKISSTNAEWTEIQTDLNQTIDEMTFLNFICGNQSIENQLVIIDVNNETYAYELIDENQSITPQIFQIENYTCNETAYFSNFMHIAGYATLMFEFSNANATVIDYAYDDCGCGTLDLDGSCVQTEDLDCTGDLITNNFIWETAGFSLNVSENATVNGTGMLDAGGGGIMTFGNLTIDSGATYNATTGFTNITGNLTVSGGTFNHNNGTLWLEDSIILPDNVAQTLDLGPNVTVCQMYSYYGDDQYINMHEPSSVLYFQDVAGCGLGSTQGYFSTLGNSTDWNTVKSVSDNPTNHWTTYSSTRNIYNLTYVHLNEYSTLYTRGDELNSVNLSEWSVQDNWRGSTVASVTNVILDDTGSYSGWRGYSIYSADAFHVLTNYTVRAILSQHDLQIVYDDINVICINCTVDETMIDVVNSGGQGNISAIIVNNNLSGASYLTARDGYSSSYDGQDLSEANITTIITYHRANPYVNTTFTFDSDTTVAGLYIRENDTINVTETLTILGDLEVNGTLNLNGGNVSVGGDVVLQNGSNFTGFENISVVGTFTINNSLAILDSPLTCADLVIETAGNLDTNNYTLNITDDTDIYGTLDAQGDTVDHYFGNKTWVTGDSEITYFAVRMGGMYKATNGVTYLDNSDDVTYGGIARFYGGLEPNNGTVHLRTEYRNSNSVQFGSSRTSFHNVIFDIDDYINRYTNVNTQEDTPTQINITGNMTLIGAMWWERNRGSSFSLYLGTNTSASTLDLSEASGFGLILYASSYPSYHSSLLGADGDYPVIVHGDNKILCGYSTNSQRHCKLENVDLTNASIEIRQYTDSSAMPSRVTVLGNVTFKDVNIKNLGSTLDLEGNNVSIQGNFSSYGTLLDGSIVLEGTDNIFTESSTTDITNIFINSSAMLNVSKGASINFADTLGAGFTGDGALMVNGNAQENDSHAEFFKSNYIRVEDHDDLDLTNNWTVSFWEYHIYGVNREGSKIYKPSNYLFQNLGSCGYTLRTTMYGAGNYAYGPDCSWYTGAAWYMFTAVYNGTHMMHYRNGVEVSNGTLSVATASSDPLYIGYPDLPSSGTYPMKHVRMYNRSLDSSEVLAIYDDNSPPADYVAYWPLNDSQSWTGYTAGEVEDLTGNHNGTWINMLVNMSSSGDNNWTINTDELTVSAFNWTTINHGNNSGAEYIYAYDSQDAGNNTGFFFQTPPNASADCIFTTSGTLTGDLACSTLIIHSGVVVDTNNNIVNVSGDSTINGGFNATGDTVDDEHGSLTINSGGSYEATQGITLITSEHSVSGKAFDLNSGGTFTHNDGTIELNTCAGCAGGVVALDLYVTEFYNLNFSAGGSTWYLLYNPMEIAVINNLNIDDSVYITCGSDDSNVNITLGNESQPGTLSGTGLFTFQTCSSYNVEIYGAAENHPGIFTHTNTDWDIYNHGNKIIFKWLDVQTPITFGGGTGQTLILDGNVSFQDLTVSAGDTLNTSGYLLNATGYNVTSNNGVNSFNGTIIADVLNVTGELNITSGQTLNLSQTSAVYYNSLNIFSDAIYHNTNETLTVTNNATSNGDILFNNGTISIDTLIINSSEIFDSNFTINGNLQVAENGAVHTYDKIIAVSKLLDINGTFNASDNSNHTYRLISIEDSGIFLAAENITWITGDLNNSGTFTHNNGTLNMTGTGSLQGLSGINAAKRLIIDTSAEITNPNSIDTLDELTVYGILNSSISSTNNKLETLHIVSSGTYHETAGITNIYNITDDSYAINNSGTFVPNNGTVFINASDSSYLHSTLSGNVYNLELNTSTVTMESNFTVNGNLTVWYGTTFDPTDASDYNLTVQETFKLNGTYDGHDSNPSFGGFWIQDSGLYLITSEETQLTGTNHEFRNDGLIQADDSTAYHELDSLINVSSGANIDMYGTLNIDFGGDYYGWNQIYTYGTLNIKSETEIKFASYLENAEPAYCGESGFYGTGNLNIEGSSSNKVNLIEEPNQFTPAKANWEINSTALEVYMRYANVSYGNNTGDYVIVVEQGIDSGNNIPDGTTPVGVDARWLFENQTTGECHILYDMTLDSDLNCSKIFVHEDKTLHANTREIRSTNYTVINGTIIGSTGDHYFTFLKVNDGGLYNATMGITYLDAGAIIEGNLTFNGGIINGSMLTNVNQTADSDVIFANGTYFINTVEFDSGTATPTFYNLQIPEGAKLNGNATETRVAHNWISSGGFLGESAVRFNGSRYIKSSSTPLIEVQEFTVEFWIKPNSSGEQVIYTVHTVRTGEDRDGYVITILDNNTILFEAQPTLAPASPLMQVNSIHAIPNNTYTHIAVVKQTNTAEIYIDGLLDNSASMGGIKYGDGTIKYAFGADYESNTGTEYVNDLFNGVLDEVRHWNAVVNEENIRAYMFKEIDSSHTNYANLKVYTQLDSSTGSSFISDIGALTLTVYDTEGTAAAAGDSAISDAWVGSGTFNYHTSKINYTGEGIVRYLTNITYYDLAVGYTSSETALFNSTLSVDDIFVNHDLYTGEGIAQFEDINVSNNIETGTGNIIANNLQLNGTLTDGGSTVQNVVNFTYTDEANIIGSSTYATLKLYGHNNLSGNSIINTELLINSDQSLYTKFYDMNVSQITISQNAEFNVSEASVVKFSSTNGFGDSSGTLNVLGTAYEGFSGVYFDGDDDYINVTEDDSLDLEDHDISLSFWINTNDTTNYILSKGAVFDSGEQGYSLRISNSVGEGQSKMNFIKKNALGAQSEYAGLGEFINDSEWHHIVVTINTTGKITAYLDGSYTDENLNSFTTQTIDVDNPLQIGADGTRKLNARLDDVRIFNRTLTTSEVTTIYSLGTVSDGLVVHYNFENAYYWNTTADEVRDLSGNENHGTTVNGAETSQAIISSTTLGSNWWDFNVDTHVYANFSVFEGYDDVGIGNYSLFGVWFTNVSGTAWYINASDNIIDFERIKITDVGGAAGVGLFINDSDPMTLVDITINETSLDNIDTSTIAGDTVEFVNSTFNISTSENNFYTDIISINHNKELGNYQMWVYEGAGGRILDLTSLSNPYSTEDSVYLADGSFRSNDHAVIKSLEVASGAVFYVGSVGGNHNLTILNGSYTPTGDVFVISGSALKKNWYVDVYTYYQSVGENNTAVTINDTFGTLVYSNTTDEDGYLQTNVSEYIITDTETTTYYSNYSLFAVSSRSSTLYGTASVNVTDNALVNISLADSTAPTVNITAPINNSYAKHSINTIQLRAEIYEAVKVDYLNYELRNVTDNSLVINASYNFTDSEVSDYNLTVSWTENPWVSVDGDYIWIVNATDVFGNNNISNVTFHLDNTVPSVDAYAVSKSLLDVNSYVDINANVTESNVDTVWIEIIAPGNAFYENFTLNYSGTGTTYNNSYQATAIGEYGQLRIWVNDSSGAIDTSAYFNSFETNMSVYEPYTLNVSLLSEVSFDLGQKIVVRVNVTDPINESDVDECLVNMTDNDNNIYIQEGNMTLFYENSTTGINIYEYNLSAVPYNVSSIGDWQIDVQCDLNNSYFNTNTTNITVVDTLPPIFEQANASPQNFGIDIPTEITANVSDILDSVWVNISWPNGNNTAYNLTETTTSPSHVGDYWNYTFNGSNEYDLTGEYNATIYANDTQGNQNEVNITFSVFDTTIATLTLDPTLLSINNITATVGANLTLNATYTNTGNATAIDVKIYNGVTPSGWSVDKSAGTGCGSISIGESCEKLYPTIIPANAQAGEHSIEIISKHTNLDSSASYTTDYFNVTILANPILAINHTSINTTVHHNVSGEIAELLLLTSAGNSILEDITFTNTSGNLNNSWVSFAHSADRNATPITELNSTENTTIYINVSVPLGYDEGNYSGIYTINATSTTCINDTYCYKELNLTVEVPNNRSWYSPFEVNTTVYDNTAGDVTRFNITNLGNVNMTWEIIGVGGNASSFVTVNAVDVNTSVEDQGTNNYSHEVYGNYSIPINQTPGIYDYVIKITNSSLVPEEINTTLRFIVVDNIDPTIVSTSISNATINFNTTNTFEASVTDNIALSQIWAIVQTPNGTNDITYLTDSPYWAGSISSGTFNKTKNNDSIILIENEYLNASDPVIMWHLNESIGSDSEDSSDNSNNITVNGASFAAGKFNNSLSFDGTDDYTNSSVITLGGIGRTISLWVKMRDRDTNRAIISKNLDFSINQTSDLQWKATSYRVGSSTSVTSDIGYDEGEWRHLAVVFNDTDKSMRLYINGQYKATDTYTELRTVSTAIELGRGASATSYFNGSIDEVLIFNRALEDTEIYQLHGDHVTLGDYISDTYNASSPAAWTYVYWNAETPTGTNVTTQFSTSNDTVTWTDWSTEFTSSGSDISALGNATYIKAKLNLNSNDTHYTPEFNNFNVTYGEGYTYRGSYNPLQEGVHNVTIYANDSSGNTNTSEAGTFNSVAITTGDLQVSCPSEITINSAENCTITLINTGNGTMYSALINVINTTDAIRGLIMYPEESNTQSCGDISTSSNCSKIFSVRMSTNAFENTEYVLSSDGNWTDPNSSLSSVSNNTQVDSGQAPGTLYVLQETITNNALEHNAQQVLGKFTVGTINSGFALINFTIEESTFNSSWMSFQPTDLNMENDTTTNVTVVVDIPKGTPPASHSAIVEVRSYLDGCEDGGSICADNVTISFQIIVDSENTSWSVTPINTYVEGEQDLTTRNVVLNVTNDGNVDINFTVNQIKTGTLSLILNDAPDNLFVTANNESTITRNYWTLGIGYTNETLTFINNDTIVQKEAEIVINSTGAAPNVTYVNITPTIVDINYSVINITSNITQGGTTELTSAWINVTAPNGSVYSASMEELDTAVDKTGIWNSSYTWTDVPGIHTVVVTGRNQYGAESNLSAELQVINLTSINITLSPESTTLSTVTLDDNQTFELNITTTNTGLGTATANVIAISLPNNFSTSPSSIDPFTLSSADNQTNTLNVTAESGLSTGYYYINFTDSWVNPDGSENSTNATLEMFISSVKAINVVEDSINVELFPDGTETNNFTVQSTGTANLNYINISCEGIDCDYFNITFDPESIASLPVGYTQVVTAEITVLNTTSSGSYVFNYSAEEIQSGKIDRVNLAVTVEENKNWTITPTTITRSVGNDTSGVFETITIYNLGNIRNTYNLSIINESTGFYSIDLSYASFDIDVDGSQVVPINYNATNTGSFNATLEANTTGSTSNINVSLYATVVPLTIDIISPTQTNTTVSDPGSSITILSNASSGSSVLTSSVDWSAKIGNISSTVQTSSYDSLIGQWRVNVTVPASLSPELNNVELFGTYSAITVSDLELYAVNVTDIAEPIFDDMTWPYTNPSENVTLYANISDQSSVVNVTMQVTFVNGTITNYTMVNLTNATWSANITNVSDVGDHDIIMFATDSWGNIGNGTTWFEVRNETLYTFSGTIIDPKDTAWSSEFEFRRKGTDYVLYDFTNNETTGIYSQQIHGRLYDIYITVNNDSILLQNVSVTSNLLDKITAYGYEVIDLTLNDVGYGPYSEIYFDSNLSSTNETITLRYDEPIAAKTLLGLYKCNSWNYISTNPLCDNYNYTRFTNTSVNLTSWEVYTDFEDITGPYMLAHFICGDQVCDEDYGESSYTCARDCGGVTSESEQTLLSAAAGSGGGGGGGGASASRIAELLETSQQEIEADTDLIQVVLYPGEYQVVGVGIKNNKLGNDTAHLSVDDSMFQFVQIKDLELELAGKDTTYTELRFTTLPTTRIGTYTGNLLVNTETGVDRKIPLILKVVEEKQPLLDVKIEALTKRVAPGETLKYQITIYNMGETKNVDIINAHIIREIDTDRVILKEIETVAVNNTLSYVRKMQIDNNTREGQYQIEIISTYADINRTAMAVTTFDVTTKPLIVDVLTRVAKSWVTYILVILFVLLVYYGPIIYDIWKKRKKQQQRYVFPLDKKYLPKEDESAIQIGRIAETQDPAYINMLDLKVHTLCAGATGGGKSVSAQIIVEECLKKGVSVIVFDPTFQWSGFINKTTDKRMLDLYSKFGIKPEESTAFNTKLYQVEDPSMKIDIKKYVIPGQITVFGMNKLRASELDTFVKRSIQSVFSANMPTTSKLKLLLVYDEVHRVLPKYGGNEGYLYLEKGVREFRKWGIGMVMISQVISDFKEAIATNIGTEVQMRTKYKGDLKRVEDKYGKEYGVALPRLKVGTGMVQNSEYNKGRPYFIEFRPLLHSTDKVSDEQYKEMKRLEQVLYKIGMHLIKLKKSGRDISDIKVEFDLAKDKLKSGNTRMVKSYVESILAKLKKM